MTDLITQLIDEIGPGRMASTAYDTAWVARLADIESNLSNQALAWLAENQLPDGSWGAPAPIVVVVGTTKYKSKMEGWPSSGS